MCDAKRGSVVHGRGYHIFTHIYIYICIYIYIYIHTHAHTHALPPSLSVGRSVAPSVCLLLFRNRLAMVMSHALARKYAPNPPAGVHCFDEWFAAKSLEGGEVCLAVPMPFRQKVLAGDPGT